MRQIWRNHGAAFPTSDASPYARRSLARLPGSERTRFLRAWSLLGNGGVLALAREGDVALSGAGVCEALLARSWAARHRDPEEMLQLALAAREVAADLKARDLGSAALADLQARAWGELANAYRVAGLRREALAAFGEAFDRLKDGSSDPYLGSHLYELEATLLGWCGNLEAAVNRLTTLAEIYRHLGEPHLAGRARVTQSIYTSRNGRKEEALRLNAEGLAQIDRRRDPRLVMTALHNRLLLLLGLGLDGEARPALAECLVFGTDRSCAVALRLRWMEGRVRHGLGDLEGAEAALRQARDGLAALGLGFFSAVASLDLAATLLRQGREQAAQGEALAAQTTLLGLEPRCELLGVVVLLDEAFRAGAATAELVERALAWLRRKELERGPRRGPVSFPMGN